MKEYIPTTALFAFATLALVSCESPSRVVDRPLGQGVNYPYSAPQQLDNAGQDGTSLLGQLQQDQLVDPANPGQTPLINPQTGNTPNTNTLGNLLGNTTPKVDPGAATATEEIPTAWPDPTNPNVVYSPYDRSKKIRITKPDGTRFPSGKIMYDPNFKPKKFRVP